MTSKQANAPGRGSLPRYGRAGSGEGGTWLSEAWLPTRQQLLQQHGPPDLFPPRTDDPLPVPALVAVPQAPPHVVAQAQPPRQPVGLDHEVVAEPLGLLVGVGVASQPGEQAGVVGFLAFG